MKYIFALFTLFAFNNTIFYSQAKVHIDPPKKLIVDKMKGLSFVGPPNIFPNDPMKAVCEVGAEWISVIPFAYSKDDKPFVKSNSKWQWWGETPKGIRKTIELAKQSNLKVMVKPQIYVPGSWPGAIDFDNDTDWELWEKDYEDYIMPFVKMADSLNVELFCIGTEFKIGVVEREVFWRNLIKKIRTIYKGKLVYSSNWDAFQNVPFWDALDYIGISAYFPLVDSKTPTVSELKKAWQVVLKRLRIFEKKINRPIIFTEFGYLSVDGCAYKTWELEKRVRETPINEEAQANAYDALFEVFWNEPYWAGGFLWKWFPNMEGGEGYNNRDYTPQGKICEKIVKKWYQGKD